MSVDSGIEAADGGDSIVTVESVSFSTVIGDCQNIFWCKHFTECGGNLELGEFYGKASYQNGSSEGFRGVRVRISIRGGVEISRR